MSKFNYKMLIAPETLLGERIVLALLSIAWGAYLIGPLAPITFLNIAGGIMFISFGISVLFEVTTQGDIRPSEGFYGICLWVIGAAYQYNNLLDDTLYLMIVPLSLSLWLLSNALANTKFRE